MERETDVVSRIPSPGRSGMELRDEIVVVVVKTCAKCGGDRSVKIGVKTNRVQCVACGTSWLVARRVVERDGRTVSSYELVEERVDVG